jgi:hypothetical protein
MAHHSTLGFSCMLDYTKETTLNQVSTVINFINYLDYERPDGFSYNEGAEKPISHLKERLDALKKTLKSKKTPDELNEDFFAQFATSNKDFGGDGIIDLEANELEFNESICYDEGGSLMVFIGTPYGSADLESLCIGFFDMISSSNPTMLPTITINDFDESYCEVHKA